ncbi:polysaccharide biosynthesis tyrosine autokinase [Tychonema sp. LEGE 07199]|uniref:GumC family protein n=1 Tax=unclassified Tychonema TaxID=2642144 RepID=UPI00187E7683|nr:MULTISPECIES: tyrosine-protein kinase domain-containing protein [unclassified Tychonema]MBE9123152.1 polysaccharide biosynthesis tyrosine autokinase [Tychonema sp. LEGE 07199]MBE9134682.1 polysaccharide biosynthesis tyrosine autokinase [Tychonema sp. LEGE 07196]
MKPGKKSQITQFNNNRQILDRQKISTAVYQENQFLDRENTQEEELSFWEICRSRSLLVIGVAVAVTTGVFAWTLTQKSEYEGRFQLLVEAPITQNTLAKIYAGELKVQPASPGSAENPGFDYESQIQVLQSPQVMSPIIKQLQAKYPEINYSYLLNQKADNLPFSGKTRLSVNRFKNTKIIEVRYRDYDPKKINFVLEKVAVGFRNYSVQDTKSQINQSLDFVKSQLPNQKKRQQLLQTEIQKLRQQYNFIDPQIQSQQLAQQISQIQAQRLDAQTQFNQQRLLYANLQNQLGLNQKQALMASALSQAPRYQAMLTQLQQLEGQIAINSATYTDQTPQIQLLREQRNNLIPLLKKEAQQVLGTDLAKVNSQVLAFQDPVRIKLIEQFIGTANLIQVLGVRNVVLEQAAKELNQYSQGFPVILRRYSDLQREAELTNNTLNSLLAKQQALQLEAVGQKEVAWEVIAKPEIPRYRNGELMAVAPIMPLNLALGGLAGLVFGMLMAQLAERFNNKTVFQTPEDVKHSIHLPLLGIIPASDKILRLPPAETNSVDAESSPMPTDAFQEAFRSLNANIRLLNVDTPINSCVITSCQVADGKSTVAVNLARAAAAMGQQVLLVDADLRRPQVHEMLGLPNWQGLHNVIAEDLDVEDAIVRSPRDENLFVLTSGPVPPDPTKVLSSRKMQHLMAALASHFDLVIYDTAPLLGLADANLLAGQTNGLMLVVGLHQTEREALLLAFEDLKMAGIPLLGMVANNDKGSRYYYQSYVQNYIEEKSV